MNNKRKGHGGKSERHNKIWKGLQTLFSYSHALEVGRGDDDLEISKRSRRNHLDELRRELGGKALFGDGHHLTELGSKCVALAAELRRRLDDALLAFNRDPVRIAMTSHISRNYLKGILEEFWRGSGSNRPVIALDRRADEVIRHVRDLKVDLGVGPLTPDEASANNLDVGRYFTSKTVVLCSPKRQPPERLTWSWLLAQPWLMHEEHTATRTLFERAYAEYKDGHPESQPINLVFETTDVKLLLDYVIADMGISFVADAPIIADARKLGQVVAMTLPPVQGSGAPAIGSSLSVAVFWLRRKPDERVPPAVEELAAIAERELAKFLEPPDAPTDP